MKINKIHTILLAASVFACISLKAGEKSNVTIPECKQAPKLNGILDDGCWKTASKIKDFIIYRRGPIGSKTNDTEVFLTRDNKFLYIGLICYNPNMQHVVQMGMGHDDGANFSDDSVEILLGRENSGYFYHYILTCANMQGEGRVYKNLARGWKMPWASATKKTDKGWAAEVAIPLFIINSSKPADIELNFLRSKIEIALDQMNAKQSEKKVMSCWKSAPPKNGRSCWPPFQPVPIEGTQNIKAAPVFLPCIEKVLSEGYEKGPNGKLQQVFETQLRNYSNISGTAKLEIVGEKSKKPLVQVNQKLSASSAGNTLLNVPTTDSGKLSLVVYGDGNLPFQTVMVHGEASLIADIFTERNYYTTEKTVNIKVEFNLSDAILKNCILILKDVAGKTVEQVVAPTRKIIIKAASNKLTEGKNIWIASLKNKDGMEYEKRNLAITKLAPNPGKEIKFDQFRRTVLVNGKPFFMYGMLYRPWLYGSLKTPEVERTYDLFAKTGFNTVINSYHSVKKGDVKWMDRIMELTQKYNLMVIDRYNSHRQALGKTKEYYEKNIKPVFLDVAKIVSKYDNLLGYWNFDEPNLGNWQESLKICGWFYKDIRNFDPYRTIFALYARNIPPVPTATEYFDIFGYDVYTYPGWGGYFDVVNSMAIDTINLDNRLKKEHKPIYITPMVTSLGVRRSPMGLTYQEQLAQNYTALIYGAKGLLYFAQLYSWGQETWKAFRRLASDLKALQPALLALPVDYKLEYPGKNIDPAKRKFPFVHAGLFKYPEGDYILLAVNSKTSPVDVKFMVNGLEKATRMFEKKTEFKVKTNTFSERLEPLAVRAYKISCKGSAPLNIRIVERELKMPKKPSKSEPIRDALNRVSARKNLVMNPSFEWEQRISGIPNYYQPYILSSLEKAGDANHPFWKLDTTDSYHGKYCFMLKRSSEANIYGSNSIRGRFACEKLPTKETAYTFSLYMKGERNGDTAKLLVTLRKGRRMIGYATSTFKLTTEWKRYSLAVKLKNPGPVTSAIPLSHGEFAVEPYPGTKLWVDAIQLEKGNKATEFSDN